VAVAGVLALIMTRADVGALVTVDVHHGNDSTFCLFIVGVVTSADDSALMTA